MHVKNGIRSRPSATGSGPCDLAADHIRSPPVLVDWPELRIRRSPSLFGAASFCGPSVFGSNQSQMGCGPKPPGCGLALGKKKRVSNSPRSDNDSELPTYGEQPALNAQPSLCSATCRSFERPLCAKYKRFQKDRK